MSLDRAIIKNNSANVQVIKPSSPQNKIIAIQTSYNETTYTLENDQKTSINTLYHNFENTIVKTKIKTKLDKFILLTNNKRALFYGLIQVENSDTDSDVGQDNYLQIELWDLSLNKKLRSKKMLSDSIERDEALLCTDQHIIVTYLDRSGYGGIDLLDINTFKNLYFTSFSCQYTYQSFLLSADKPILIIKSEKYLGLWEITDNRLILKYTLPLEYSKQIHTFSTLADCKTIVAGLDNGGLKFWEFREDEQKLICISYFQGYGTVMECEPNSNIAAIQDGRHIITWDNRTAYLWDITNLDNPHIINKVKHTNILGHGNNTITEHGKVITSLNNIIEFPEVYDSLHKMYKDTLFQQTSMANDVVNLTLSYLNFFKPLSDVTKPDSSKPNTEIMHGVKRTFELI